MIFPRSSEFRLSIKEFRNLIALVGGAPCKTPEDFVSLAKTLDKAAKEVGAFNFIGGYSATVWHDSGRRAFDSFYS